MPKISIVIPTYSMENGVNLLQRNLESIMKQRFTDYEIVVTDNSDDDAIKHIAFYYPVRYIRNREEKGMAKNTNFAIDQAQGELIKILYQDDFLYYKDSLQDIVNFFTPTCKWLVTKCVHTKDGVNFFSVHSPFYSESENTIGSPSVVTLHRDIMERFDPQFSWVIDLDLYKRIFKKYGLPKIMNRINVVIGLGEHQVTNKLSKHEKLEEELKLKAKYE